MSLSVSVTGSHAPAMTARREQQQPTDAAPVAMPSQRPVEASGSGAAAGLGALLGHLGSGGGATTSASPQVSEATHAEAIKPNLDALNRVLAHYAAQNAAADTVISLVRP